MPNFLYNTLHPEIYHGHGRKPPFFEGWYFKLISADERHRYAIIPGAILGTDGHAFIQIMDGANGQSSYHRYPLDSFWAAQQEFSLQISNSTFDNRHIHLEVDTPAGQILGDLAFDSPKPWPVTITSPGIMGWYTWVPKMECYHGVLSFDHAIQGKLAVNGQELDFDAGRGYIEKDWGQSFPAAWVWFQSNHFEQPAVCLTASIAIIPWLGSAFPGFIVGLWLNRRLYRFATYTGARTERLQISDQQVDWVVANRSLRLEMHARRAEGGLLKGPTRLDMGKRVVETLNASVEVRLSERDGRVLFAGSGRHAGLEVFDPGKLQAML